MYNGDFGESAGMSFRLNPVGDFDPYSFDDDDERLKWNWDDIVVRKTSRLMAIEIRDISPIFAFEDGYIICIPLKLSFLQ